MFGTLLFIQPLPRLFFISCMFLLPLLAQAQGRKYVFSRLTEKDGLVSNHVYSVLQDKKGFIWIGTANGLQRYDGRKMALYQSSGFTTKYLPPVGIGDVFADTSHQFWVRCLNNDVGLFDPGNLEYKKAKVELKGEPPPRAENFLWQDRKGNVFLIITRYNVLTYDRASHTFREDPKKLDLPRWNIRKLLDDPDTGEYWMGSDSGLVLYDPVSKSIHSRHQNPRNLAILKEKAFHDPVLTFFIDNKKRFWITTWNSTSNSERFYCYDLKSNKLLPEVEGLNERHTFYSELRGFSQLSGGEIWGYGRMIFSEYDSVQRKFNFLRDVHIDDYGIKYDYVFCMYEDREHNVWVGTDQGLFMFNPTREIFKSISLVNSQPDVKWNDLAVNSLLETRNGQLLAGTWGLGTLTYDKNFVATPNTIIKGSPLHDASYLMQWDMHEEERNGKIWIACQGGRLQVYDPGTKKSIFYTPPVFDKRTIRQVTEDHEGNIWLGSQYGHIVKWSPDAGYTENFGSGFRLVHDFKTIIAKMRVDRQGFLWVCTHNRGLFKMDPVSGKIVVHYDSKKGKDLSLFGDVVDDIVQYNDSLFFINSGVLNLLNSRSGKIQWITPAEGLPSLNSTSLELDQDNNLWIGQLHGICRYNHKRKTFTMFSRKDGILGGSFERNASLVLRNGKMVFGNPHDIVFFDPNAVYSASKPLDVTITDFKLFNSYLPPDSVLNLDKIRLCHTQNSFAIEFATLSFWQQDKTVYYFWMEGIDKTWICADQGNIVNYSLLPPGDYTFKVKCENAEGVESANITTLKIRIDPPFWLTWWFLTLLGLIVAGIIFLIHLARVKRILAMEKVRRRIARDLHDDMGSTLSTINILSEMAKMKVSVDSGKTKEYLNKISDNSSRMMEAMDDIVWSINPMNDSMQKITARMREFATGTLEAKNIEFVFRVDEEVAEVKLDMEARRDYFLIFKEAVNNLAKYSQCSLALIEITVDDKKLKMKIRDNGVGFDVASADSGNGLINMRKRAYSLGGQITIQSSPGEGTKILLEVPLT